MNNLTIFRKEIRQEILESLVKINTLKAIYNITFRLETTNSKLIERRKYLL